MLDVLFAEESENFKSKLIDIGNNRIDSNLTSKSRYAGNTKSSFTEDQVIAIDESLFMVESEANSDKYYSVDMRYFIQTYLFKMEFQLFFNKIELLQSPI